MQMTFFIVLALCAPLVAAVFLWRKGEALSAPTGSQGFDSSNFAGGGGCDFGGGGDCSG
jgi:hypothetical protein